MILYQETELDEYLYQHNAVYHANRELVRNLVEAGVLVPVEPTARFRLTGGDYGNFGYRIHAEEYRLDNDQGLMDAPYGMYLLIPDTAVGEETP